MLVRAPANCELAGISLGAAIGFPAGNSFTGVRTRILLYLFCVYTGSSEYFLLLLSSRITAACLKAGPMGEEDNTVEGRSPSPAVSPQQPRRSPRIQPPPPPDETPEAPRAPPIWTQWGPIPQRRVSEPAEVRGITPAFPSALRSPETPAGGLHPSAGADYRLPFVSPRTFVPPEEGQAALATVTTTEQGVTVRFPVIYYTLPQCNCIIFPFTRTRLGSYYFPRQLPQLFGFAPLHALDRPAVLAAQANLPPALVKAIIYSIHTVVSLGSTERSLRLWGRTLRSPHAGICAQEACQTCGRLRTVSLYSLEGITRISGGVRCQNFGQHCAPLTPPEGMDSPTPSGQSTPSVRGREPPRPPTLPPPPASTPGFPPAFPQAETRHSALTMHSASETMEIPLYVAGEPLQAPNYVQAIAGAEGTIGSTGVSGVQSRQNPGQRTHLGSPHPNHFIRGFLAHALQHPGGTEEDRRDNYTYHTSPGWERIYQSVQRAIQSKTLAPFTGTAGMAEFMKWKTSLKGFFHLIGVRNILAQAQLAVATLQEVASMWWWTHYEHTPERLYALG